MKKLYRGPIINPISSSECEKYLDGALVVNDEGKIEYCGDYKEFNDVEIIEIEGKIIIPAFCDVHIHLPQYDVRGTFSGNELLPWLKKYIWPEEDNFKDKNHTQDVAKRFYEDLVKNGTLTAVIYGTVHEEAIRIMFEECPLRGIIGKMMMDQNSPDYLLETTSQSLEDTENLCKEYGNNYVISPRFAPTCSMDLMKGAADLAKKYNTYIQTHLNENKDEIQWVKELFPDCKSYTEVYLKAGLLGPKTIMGHVIHSADEELELLKKTDTKIAHCPTSNVALKSGTMPIRKIEEFGLKFALSTDVGAGPHVSMLDVMRSFMEVHNNYYNCDSALYFGTLAGAEVLGIENETGNLQKGKYADFLILDYEILNKEDLEEVIDKACNDQNYDKAIQKTYFKGKQLYSK